jgi:hypothetical protein
MFKWMMTNLDIYIKQIYRLLYKSTKKVKRLLYESTKKVKPRLVQGNGESNPVQAECYLDHLTNSASDPYTLSSKITTVLCLLMPYCQEITQCALYSIR